MNKLLNNLLGMYKQAKLNKKAEEVVYDSDLIAQVLSMTKNQKEDEFSIVTLSPEKDKVLGVKYIKKDEVYDYKPNQNEYALVMTRDTGFADTDYQLQPMIMVVRSWNEGRKFYATKKNRLNKKAEEKEAAKKDYTEQYAKVKEIIKEYGYGLSDGGYIYLISKEEPKDEGFQVKFKGDRLRVELDGKLKYSGYGPEAIEDFLKGMFYAKKLSSKNTKLTKKADYTKEEIEMINKEKEKQIECGEMIWKAKNALYGNKVEECKEIVKQMPENCKLNFVVNVKREGEDKYYKKEINEIFKVIPQSLINEADEILKENPNTLYVSEWYRKSSKAKDMSKKAEYTKKDYLNHFREIKQDVLFDNKGNFVEAVKDLLGFASSEYDKARFPREDVYNLVKEYIDDTINFQEMIHHPIKEEYIVKAKELLNKYKVENKIANSIKTLHKKAEDEKDVDLAAKNYEKNLRESLNKQNKRIKEDIKRRIEDLEKANTWDNVGGKEKQLGIIKRVENELSQTNDIKESLIQDMVESYKSKYPYYSSTSTVDAGKVAFYLGVYSPEVLKARKEMIERLSMNESKQSSKAKAVRKQAKYEETVQGDEKVKDSAKSFGYDIKFAGHYGRWIYYYLIDEKGNIIRDDKEYQKVYDEMKKRIDDDIDINNYDFVKALIEEVDGELMRVPTIAISEYSLLSNHKDREENTGLEEFKRDFNLSSSTTPTFSNGLNVSGGLNLNGGITMSGIIDQTNADNGIQSVINTLGNTNAYTLTTNFATINSLTTSMYEYN